MYEAVPWFLLPIAAEIMIEVRILRLREIWAKASVLLLVMHFFTVPLLWFFLGSVISVAKELSFFEALSVGEVGIIAIEAAIFYVACLQSAKFRRSFLCCLRASAVGNSVSLFIPFAAQSLANYLV
jgi:hypothetical protein